MHDDDWRIDFAKAIGVFLNGEEIPHHGPVSFPPPARRWWAVELDTSRSHVTNTVHLAGEKLPVEGRSVLLLKRI